jgi:hypothetical protein
MRGEGVHPPVKTTALTAEAEAVGAEVDQGTIVAIVTNGPVISGLLNTAPGTLVTLHHETRRIAAWTFGRWTTYTTSGTVTTIGLGADKSIVALCVGRLRRLHTLVLEGPR